MKTSDFNYELPEELIAAGGPRILPPFGAA